MSGSNLPARILRIPGLGSLAGRLSWLIIGVLLLTQLVAFFIYFTESEQQYYELQGEERIRRMVAVMNAVEGKSVLRQEDILDAASDDEFALYIDHLALPTTPDLDTVLTTQLRALNRLAQRQGRIIVLADLTILDNPAYQQLVDDLGEGWQGLVLAALPLRDGSWLYATLFDRETVLLSELGLELLYTLPMLLLVAGVIIFSTRRLTRPLALLADRAGRFGRGEAFQPLPLRGTDEVQQATHAFNTMAERLERHVSDRQQLLAAISHDLRSPLTGMRIQAEFIADEQVRSSMVAGMEEMEQMLGSVLNFTHEDAAAEQVVTVDMQKLLQGLVQHYRLQQHTISLHCAEGAAGFMVKTRPLALKRALRNILENAFKYGECAAVYLSVDAVQARIVIEDQGSGIPPHDLERVFEPFTQLDRSRPQARGGVGMGLSVVRSLLRSLGGEVALANRDGVQSGLRVTVNLPL